MKIRIEDKAALGALSWVDLKAYLDAEGWNREGTYADKAAIYTKIDSTGRMWEVLVPLRDDLADYASSMGTALGTLAHVEGRDESEVFNTLSTAGADVVRLRASEADAEGTIALSHGVAIFREAENLMLAAACAAREPRRSYHARKIAEVRDFLDTVRLGQTECGSYVVAIRCPVAPTLRATPSQSTLFEHEPEDDVFSSRAVTLKLADALQSVGQAVSGAIDNNRFDAFETAVQHGVNANLCDALSQLAELGAGLDVSISWARVRPTAGHTRQYRFSREMGRVLKEAAKEFRRHEPKLEETVEGFVTHLDRPPEEFNGRATLRVLLEGRPRRLGVTFEPSEYTPVIRAHDERVAISLDGDIYPVGQRFELRNPRNLRLLTEPNEPDEAAPAVA